MVSRNLRTNRGSYGAAVAYVRTVKTASGATAVQIVWSSRRGSRNIEHVGSAHDDAEVEALKAAASQRISQGQGELDLGLDPAEIASGAIGNHRLPSRASLGRLVHGLRGAGFDGAAGGDEVFRDLVLARIIEPTSKADSLRVLAETGIEAVTYRTLTRRLPGYAKDTFRAALSAACTGHAGLGPASLVLYDVTTLYFETDAAMDSASPGSPRNAAWNRRSPSGCSPMPPASRWQWGRSKATSPRPTRCCRSSTPSRQPTSSPM